MIRASLNWLKNWGSSYISIGFVRAAARTACQKQFLEQQSVLRGGLAPPPDSIRNLLMIMNKRISSGIRYHKKSHIKFAL
jgi:hypothetical protein